MTDWMKASTSLLVESASKEFRVLEKQTRDQMPEKWIQELTGAKLTSFINVTSAYWRVLTLKIVDFRTISCRNNPQNSPKFRMFTEENWKKKHRIFSTMRTTALFSWKKLEISFFGVKKKDISEKLHFSSVKIAKIRFSGQKCNFSI